MSFRSWARLAGPLFGILVSVACTSDDGPPARPPAADPIPFALPAASSPVFALGARDVDPHDPKVQLGRRLFNDARLSAGAQLACAACHDVAGGGDDGRRYSRRSDGRDTAYNTPTVLNSSLNFAQFWDGRARTLEAQIRMTLSGPEMGLGAERAAAALEHDADVVAAFERAYGAGLTAETLVDAVATYVRALTTPGAPFDRYLNGERTAIDAEARKGWRLFNDLGCVSCHQGRNFGGNLFQHLGVMTDYFADRGELTEADYGRYNVTGRDRDRFKFKVPSLRNVAETAPYFHDGSAATLEEAVRAMLRYQLGREADAADVAALVAFLETLSAPVDEEALL